jgi:DNA-binding beta-propeller fold protein YncE
VDPADGLTLFVAGSGNHKIRKVSASGIISTIAGSGRAGYDDGYSAALDAVLNTPSAVWVLQQGDQQQHRGMYFTDTGNYVIRCVHTADGAMGLVSGLGGSTYNGDAVMADRTGYHSPTGLFFDDKTGNVLVADSGNNRVRMITAEPAELHTSEPS